MSDGFTIYALDDRYVAVTNPIRRRILEALESEDRTLGDLVEITDRSKSTLSAVHMTDLRERGLVEERPDPDDGRIKLYELAGRRIGSSSLPVEDLRDAVREYVTSPEGGLAVPLSGIFAAFDRLPELEEPERRWVRLFGERIGALAAHRFKEREPAPLLNEIGEIWQREGLGSFPEVQADAASLHVTHAPDADPGGTRCDLLAGFLQGVMATRSGHAVWVEERRCGSETGDRTCVVSVQWDPG